MDITINTCKKKQCQQDNHSQLQETVEKLFVQYVQHHVLICDPSVKVHKKITYTPEDSMQSLVGRMIVMFVTSMTNVMTV